MLTVISVLGVVTGSAVGVTAWARARGQMLRLSGENARLAAENRQDPLTGLANRRGVEQALASALARPSSLTGVLYIDLDDFKGVNDRHGHRCGDDALVTIAERLRHRLPDGACAGRLGGDELIVVLPAIMSAATAAQLADEVRADLARPITISHIDEPLRVTVSIGVAAMHSDATVDADAAELLVERANAAMRRAKASGRDRVMATHVVLL